MKLTRAQRRLAKILAAAAVILPTALTLNPQARLGSSLPPQTKPVVDGTPVPTSIDRTGATDVTDALNAFLASLPDNTKVALPAGASYRVDGSIALVDTHGLTLEGNGARLFASPGGDRGRVLLSVVGGSDLTVRGLRLQGANPDGGTDGLYVTDLEGQHGIRLLGVQRVLLEGNTITDVWGDLVYLGHDLRKKLPSWRQPSTDVVIRNNTMSGTGRQGIALTHAERVLITDNNITDVRRSMFDLEPATSAVSVEDVVITNNVVGTHRLNFLAAGGGGAVHDILVANNDLRGDPMNTMIKNPFPHSRHNWSFVGNRSDTGFGSGLIGIVVARGVEGLQFRDNVHPVNVGRNMVGVLLDGACGAVVSGNVLENAVAQSQGANPKCDPALNLGTLGAVARPAAIRVG